mgnify:CR=1 FL=1|tara:strand:+ start:7232 stop:7534 length:303 start_codon:yes stop_codon:yes gene_type:complete
MSARRPTPQTQVTALQKELEELKRAAVESAAVQEAVEEPTDAYDNLSPTEQSAANLGVAPDAWKPIAFMNNSHYQALVKANAIDDALARRIEAYRVVASS